MKHPNPERLVVMLRKGKTEVEKVKVAIVYLGMPMMVHSAGV